MKIMNTCRKYGQKAALAATAVALPAMAMANDNALVTAATGELATAKGAVTSIGGVVIGVVATLVVVGLIIKAMRKGG